MGFESARICTKSSVTVLTVNAFNPNNWELLVKFSWVHLAVNILLTKSILLPFIVVLLVWVFFSFLVYTVELSLPHDQLFST